MKPTFLKLTGFTGISSGQGKESIEWNLETIPKDAMLVAITGPNGAGKTTLMDNLHPYRVMPSRASSPTPGGFSYYDNMSGMSAAKELVWEHAGNRYKSIINLKMTGKTRKQEAFLLLHNGADYAPFVTPSGLSSDGKADTYDECVMSILGTPEVFFSSAFSSQGKRTLSSLTTGEVKALLGSMLGTGDLKALSEKASDVAKLLRPSLESLKSQALPSQQKIAREPIALARLSSLNEEADRIQALETAAQTEILTKTEELGRAKSLIERQQSIQAQKESIEERITASKSATVRFLADLKDQQRKNRSGVELRLTETNAVLRTEQQTADGANRRVKALAELAAKLGAAKTAKLEQQRLQSEIGQIRSKVEELLEDTKPLNDLREQSANLATSLATLSNTGKSLSEVIAAAKSTAALIGQVPCQGTSMQMGCQLLEQANGAANSLPKHEAKLVDMRAAYRKNDENFKVSKRVLESLLVKEGELGQKRHALSQLETKFGEAREAAAMMQSCLDAAEQLPLAQVELNESGIRQQELTKTIQSVRQEIEGIANRDAQEFLSAEQSATDSLARLERELSALPKLLTTDDLATASNAVDVAQQQVRRLKGQAAEVANETALLATELVLIGEAKNFVKSMDQKACTISDEMSQWTLLSKAFGNDGIIALSIDDAGPEISRIANRLLDECYGGRFQVRLETQKATATGTVKEGFEIMVSDAQRGEDKAVGAMSGGEKVWINECVVRAFALYMTQANGTHFDTLFCDESDGALDPERKRQFMYMKKAVLKAGGYDREYLITQTPELWMMADHIVDVSTL